MTAFTVDVQHGEGIDALRYSLSANALHGLPRNGADFRKAYDTACTHGLVGAADVDAVRDLLHCSTRTAYDLTAAARRQAEAERDQQIADMKAKGNRCGKSPGRPALA